MREVTPGTNVRIGSAEFGRKVPKHVWTEEDMWWCWEEPNHSKKDVVTPKDVQSTQAKDET